MKLIDFYVEFMQSISDWIATGDLFEVSLVMLLLLCLLAMMGLLLLLLNK